MKSTPLLPAEIDFSDPLSPRSPLFEDRYHAPYGAFEQAAHVFLAGNDLPARWQGRDRFTILETGFGLGNNFLATWAAWRADPGRAQRLCFISVEKHPLRLPDLRRALADAPLPALASLLCAAWPPLTPDLHRLSFDEGRVELLLVFGDATERLRQVIASVDAFFLDGFAPARNPQMWTPDLFKALSRLAAPGTTAATWSAARAVRDGLQQAGFPWRRADGAGGKFDITLAHFAPRVTMPRPAARRAPPRPRHVAIIGGGLAGAACAQALAREGLRCSVFDRHAAPAQEASGNAAGLYHGVFHPDDGLHARAHRAAALAAAPEYARALGQGVPGRGDGLLRLVPERADAAPLDALLSTSGLPPEYLQAWSSAQVREAGGPNCAAWFYPAGGWISPGALVRWWLAESGAEWRGGSAVARLERIDEDGNGNRNGNDGADADADADADAHGNADDADTPPRTCWRLFDDRNAPLADVDAVVFANAGDATALWQCATDAAGHSSPADEHWIAPLTLTRGQVGIVAGDTPGLRAPARPIAGSGYALTLPDGAVMCGATTSADDPDPAVRLADHAHNLRQLAAVTGSTLTMDNAPPDAHTAADLAAQGRMQGRVGWRATASDRLPLIGAVPMQPSSPLAARLDQPRHWPRVPGLFVVAGLGSRGLTWAPLAARLIASWIVDAPFPLPADLVDALDPARFGARAVRASRRPAASPTPGPTAETLS